MTIIIYILYAHYYSWELMKNNIVTRVNNIIIIKKKDRFLTLELYGDYIEASS